MCLHGSRDNGQTDAASAIFSGSCLIYLVELDEQLLSSPSGTFGP